MMAVLPVRLYTDKILHQECQQITDFTGLEPIVNDMIQTMMVYKGVGLAASQVGLPLSLAILYLEDKSKILIIANPKILHYTKETEVMEEGCLSAPGIFIPVKRYKGIEIEAQLLTGEKVNLKFEGFDAKIVQHELNHLLGKTIVDELKL